MNFILKILQGPNAGAEIALVAGTTVSLGRDEACDIVLGDQMLPEKAGDLVVEANQVTLRLPDESEERLIPLHVKMLATTAIVIGPAEGAWDTLVWPEAAGQVAEPPNQPPPSEAPKQEPPRPRRLQKSLLFLLILIVLLLFAAWLFWPQANTGMRQTRGWFHKIYARLFTNERPRQTAQPVCRQTLAELADAYGVQAVEPPEGSDEPPALRGNLLRRADRLRLTAMAYNAFPGVALELSDDESLRTSAEELLNMVTEGTVKVASAGKRRLALAGTLTDANALRRMLEAIQADVVFVESVDCSQVEIATPPKPATPPPMKPAVTPTVVTPPEVPAEASATPTKPELPVVGVLMVPYPCLVMRDGTRVLEGADFHGFTVARITEDSVLLRQGETTLEWKP